MIGLNDWIKQHQVTAFFIIAFAITWGLGFPYGAVYKGQFRLAPLAFVGICGLALAGIIISTVCNTQPRLHSRTSPLIAALILALFWAPWHFFLRQAEGKPVITWQYWLEQYALLLPATFIYCLAV